MKMAANLVKFVLVHINIWKWSERMECNVFLIADNIDRKVISTFLWSDFYANHKNSVIVNLVASTVFKK